MKKKNLSECRMASRGQFVSSSSLIGRNKECQSQGRDSSISLARCTKLRSSLARTGQLLCTAGTTFFSHYSHCIFINDGHNMNLGNLYSASIFNVIKVEFCPWGKSHLNSLRSPNYTHFQVFALPHSVHANSTTNGARGWRGNLTGTEAPLSLQRSLVFARLSLLVR